MAEFNWTPDELQEIVDNNRLVLFMKGTPEQAGESGDTAFDPHGEEVEFFGVHIRRPDKE